MDKYKSPDVIILSGGLGTRLREAVPQKQKVMADVGGRPFLAYLFKRLVDAGVHRVILALGYRGEDAFKEALLHKPKELTLVASMENEPLGTAGALRNALKHIKTKELLVINGDSVVDLPLKHFLDFHKSVKSSFSILLCKTSSPSRYGTVTLRENSTEVLSFQEKSTSMSGSALINAGIYVLPSSLVASLNPGSSSLERDILPGLCDGRLQGMTTNARFLDIGVPEDYKKAAQFFNFSIQTE